MAGQPQHKDGRTTETRQLILKEAEKLYYAGGYEKISLQVIADHLQISKAALFHHFKNKRELFFEVAMMILAHMREIFERIINEEGLSTRERLFLIMQRLAQEPTFDVMRFLREDYPRLEEDQQRQGDAAWNQYTFGIIQRVFKEGIGREDLCDHDVTLSAYLFLNMCILLPHTDNPMSATMESVSRDGYISALLDMLLNGLSKKKTR